MSREIPLNRRQFVAASGALLGALALRGYAVESRAAVHYTHGVASGDPLADRVILWTRVLPGDGAAKGLEGRWQVAKDTQFRKVVAEGPVGTGSHRDHTVKVDATGLAPGETYFYRFEFEGVVSPVGRTKTLPIGGVDQFKIGVCSCSNYPQGYFNAYRDIARAELDVVMHLGDYIYEYPANGYANPYAVETLGRQVVPPHELIALEDYRQRYGLYRTDADLQAAHAAHPWIVVWDDHELANDTWHSGAQNHNAGEGEFAARMQAARKAYHEWMPIRTPAQTDQGPIYRQFAVGDLADLIMLDTRLIGRDQQLDYRRDMPAGSDPRQFKAEVLGNPERTMIGADQSLWLANQLQASSDRGAPWQFIGQQVLMGKLLIPKLSQAQLSTVEIPERTRGWINAMLAVADFGMPMNLDAWDGYPACRERVFQQLLELAQNPFVVAGDTHNAWAFNLRTESGRAVGVEIGCPGISSPGMESYLPLPAAMMAKALRESSPELVDLDTSQRGWALVELTPKVARSQWRYVSTVLSRDFSVATSEVLECRVGQRAFS